MALSGVNCNLSGGGVFLKHKKGRRGLFTAVNEVDTGLTTGCVVRPRDAEEGEEGEEGKEGEEGEGGGRKGFGGGGFIQSETR